MPNRRGMVPQITWGPSWANVIGFRFPFDDVITYGEPREGSEVVQGASGVEDSWMLTDDNVFEGTWRWIPQVTTLGATGFDTATIGVRLFLSWARAKNPFRFYPNLSGEPTVFFLCYLVEPMIGGVEMEPDRISRRIRVKFRTVDQAPFDGY